MRTSKVKEELLVGGPTSAPMLSEEAMPLALKSPASSCAPLVRDCWTSCSNCSKTLALSSGGLPDWGT
eukprot:1137843-Alexandrium_andersonii.AAC.1